MDDKVKAALALTGPIAAPPRRTSAVSIAGAMVRVSIGWMSFMGLSRVGYGSSEAAARRKPDGGECCSVGFRQQRPPGVKLKTIRTVDTDSREREFYREIYSQHRAQDWRALALTQVHHGSRLSDSLRKEFLFWTL